MKLNHTALILIITVIWGFNFVAAKYSVGSFDPFAANALRFTVVFACFLPFFKLVPGHHGRLIGVAFLLGVAHFGFMFVGLATGVDISSMAIATQLNVPFSALLAVMLLGEKVGWRRWSAIGLSFLGVIVISFDPLVFQHIDAILWITLSAFCYGVAAVGMRSLKDVPALTTQSWVALAGSVGSLAISLLFESNHSEMVQTASVYAWAGVLYSALFSSVIGHGGVNYLLRIYDIAMVTPYFLLMPIFAILGGYLFFDESLTPRIAVGGLLTMAGVTIITVRNQSKQLAQSATAESVVHQEG